MGFQTDVVGNEPLLGATAAQVEDQEKYRPIMGGCQITEGKGRSNNKGTLGCAVRFIGEDRHDGLKKGNIYVLSASHVMLDVGNAIYQPWDPGLFNAQYMTRIARMARMPPKAMRWRPSVTL